MSSVEQLEAENAELKSELAELLADIESTPDFTDPTAVVVWFGREIVRLLASARREKSLVRLRALNSSIDSWSRAFRLASDTSELEKLKTELDELRDLFEAEHRTGPVGVTR